MRNDYDNEIDEDDYEYEIIGAMIISRMATKTIPSAKHLSRLWKDFSQKWPTLLYG